MKALPLLLEIARDPIRGLMDRTAFSWVEAPRDVFDARGSHSDGMIFPGSADGAFHNVRTLLPLDVVFIDNEGRVAAIRPMRTIVESGGVVERVESPGPFRAALEVRRGLLARAGVPPLGAWVEPLVPVDKDHVLATLRWP